MRACAEHTQVHMDNNHMVDRQHSATEVLPNPINTTMSDQQLWVASSSLLAATSTNHFTAVSWSLKFDLY